jgi:hypothetical protein
MITPLRETMVVSNHRVSLLFGSWCERENVWHESLEIDQENRERSQQRRLMEGLYLRMTLTMRCEARSISILLLPESAYLDTRMRDPEDGAM